MRREQGKESVKGGALESVSTVPGTTAGTGYTSLRCRADGKSGKTDSRKPGLNRHLGPVFGANTRGESDRDDFFFGVAFLSHNLGLVLVQVEGGIELCLLHQ